MSLFSKIANGAYILGVITQRGGGMGWLNKCCVLVSERVVYSLYSLSQKKMKPCTSTGFHHV